MTDLTTVTSGAMNGTQHQTRILVIDDTPANLQVLFDLLSVESYTVLVAQSGEKGLDRARMAGPDLILLDIRMPGMSGIETCRRLKEAEQTRDIPVLFVTALSDSPTMSEAFAAGGVDYIEKPFDGDVVLSRIRTHLELSHVRKDLARRNADLEAALKREQDLVEWKNRFFSTAVHELRTPLMNVLLSTSMLRRFGSGLSDDDRLEECDAIDQAVRQVNSTISDVLDYVREGIDPQRRSIEDLDLPAEVRRALKPLLDGDESRVKLEITCDEHVVRTDPVALQQIITNVTGNALKFSKSEIELRVRSTDGILGIEVEDSGIGIPLADLRRIQEPFFRAGNTGTIQGSGLGLSIVRELVDQLDGTFEIDSRLGKGTRVNVTLPLEA